MRSMMAATLLASGMLVTTAFAQGPTAAPYPTMPWSPLRKEQQQVLRYIPVPPQRVVIDVPVPPPPAPPAESGEGKASPEGEEAAAPPASSTPSSVQQVVEIPGYTITETTTGYIVPERWTLERAGKGYRWRKLPAEFRQK